MSAAGRSSDNTVEPSAPCGAGSQLTLAMVPIDRISFPEALFDDRVPVNEAALSLFLPIIVHEKGQRYSIIDGCKRFKALASRNVKALACGILGNDDVAGLKAALLRIELNSGRNLHPREKLLFIGWLKANLDTKIYIEQAEKLINLLPNERHAFEQLLGCKEALVEAVMEGRLDPAVAPEMNHIQEPDLSALLKLFSCLSFSRQMQRELAEWLSEIAFVNKTPVEELLASEPFSGILSSEKLNDPQKIAGIHEIAHTIRFPLYASTKNTWTEQSRRLNPDPSRVVFQASPYFEKNSLEIRIKAGDAASIKQLLQKLAAIDLEAWQKLVDPT